MANVQISLKNQLPMITKMLPDKFEQAMLKSAISINNSIKRSLTGTRSGYTYNVAGTGRVVNKEKKLPNGRTFYYRKLEGATTYRASAPYEPPATRLGHLRKSYQYKVVGHGFEAIAYVGSGLKYAPMLEYGTSNMHPRPHLKPAFEKAKNRILKNFEALM
jgi:hypothetical protein